MGKFNPSKVGTTKVPDSVNMAGGIAFSRDYKQELASVLLTAMMNGDKYYQTEKDKIKQITDLIKKGVAQDDVEFVAKAMLFARTDGKLRSVSHLVAVTLAEEVKGSPILRKAFLKTFMRPDDMTETMSLWLSKHPNVMLPNALRRSYKDAFETKFDMYQLKKYEASTAVVKLADVVKLSRPSPANFEDVEVFKKLIEGRLPNVVTAQTINAGSTGEDRAGNYMSVLKERKLGYMALVKNLKNILEAGVTADDVKIITDTLTNERMIAKSMLLPFRFYDAYTEVNKLNLNRLLVKKITTALETAFGISTMNTGIVAEGESVGVLHDCSGSMGSGAGTPFRQGMVIAGAMLQGLPKEDSLVYLWSNKATEVKFSGSAFDFIDNTHAYGGGTDIASAFSELIRTKTKLDKLVITTDMQSYALSGYSSRKPLAEWYAEYRKISPNVKILFWNLSGYAGGAPMKLDHNVLEVAGFSEKMFDVIPLMWADKDALVKRIESIEL
jgi:hypothetical protein